MASGIRSVNDTSRTYRITNVEDFHIFTCKSFLNIIPDRGIRSHSETYETIVKRKFFFFSIVFYEEGMCLYFLQGCIRHLSYMMFFHAFFHA